jgi:hypothetical protein
VVGAQGVWVNEFSAGTCPAENDFNFCFAFLEK